MDNRKAITKPIIQAAIILAAFYALEVVFVYLDVFSNNNLLLSVDILLRIIFGTVSLILLKNYSNRGESKYSVKELFTNRIPAGTWLVLIPFIIYLILPFLRLTTAYAFGISVGNVLVITQQLAVGYFEEATHRGLMMNGLIKHNTNTIKQRLFSVFIAGAFFGLSHALNIFFGENPLVQVPFTMLWGMFIAAIYMLSDNLLLVMVLHTLSDTTFRIVKLFGIMQDAPICRAVEITRDVIEYAVLPVIAILICIFYDKLKLNAKTKK